MKFARPLFLAFAFFTVFVSTPVFAEDSAIQKQSVEIEIGDDFYSVGNFVELKNDAADDVFLGGAVVNIFRAIAHDLVAVGSSLTVNSAVGDDLRVAGSVVNLLAQIGGDALVAGGVVNFASESTVGGDALFAGGVVNFGGTVAGDLNLFGDEINFTGAVDGDATIRVGQKLHFADGAKISGKLIYFAKEEIEIPAVIAAEVEFKNSAKTVAGVADKMSSSFISTTRILIFAISFIAGAVLLAIYGRGSAVFAETVRTKFWRSLLVGALAIFVSLVVVALLFATVVGSLLAVLIGLSWIIFLVVAGALGGFVVGSFIFSQKDGTKYPRKLLTLFIGGILLVAVGVIPIFGVAFRIVVFMLTLGAAILTELELYKRMKKAKLL